MTPFNPGLTSQGDENPDNLLAGDFDRETKTVTIEDGTAAMVRGAVLGRVTATGEYNLSLSAAGDGSEVPEAILAEDADASAAAVDAPVYLTGTFNEDALVLGAAHTLDSIRQGLRDKGIFLKTVVPR